MQSELKTARFHRGNRTTGILHEYHCRGGCDRSNGMTFTYDIRVQGRPAEIVSVDDKQVRRL